MGEALGILHSRRQGGLPDLARAALPTPPHLRAGQYFRRREPLLFAAADAALHGISHCGAGAVGEAHDLVWAPGRGPRQR